MNLGVLGCFVPRNDGNTYRHCETPMKASNKRKMTKEKNVILNEVKNLCSGLTFCYDAILHFVQNDKGGRGRMTDTRFVIGRNEAIQKK